VLYYLSVKPIKYNSTKPNRNRTDTVLNLSFINTVTIIYLLTILLYTVPYYSVPVFTLLPGANSYYTCNGYNNDIIIIVTIHHRHRHQHHIRNQPLSTIHNHVHYKTLHMGNIYYIILWTTSTITTMITMKTQQQQHKRQFLFIQWRQLQLQRLH
jgi:hypothetical protein